MSARAIEAVTAHIHRAEINIATAITVILVDTSGKGGEKGTDSQMARAREVPGQTNIEVGRNHLERESLLVGLGAFEEMRGWCKTHMERSVAGADDGVRRRRICRE